MSTGESKHAFELLGENNYNGWEINAKGALLSKRVWRVVIGEETAPVGTVAEPLTRKEKQAWHDKVDTAAGVILSIIDDNNQSLISDETPDPVKMWKKLQDTHQQKKPSSRFAAYEALLNLTLNDGESLPSVAARAKALLRNMRNLMPAKDFTFDKLSEELASMAIIRSLPLNDYGAFRSQLLLRDDLSLSSMETMLFSEQSNREKSVAQQKALAAVAAAASTDLKCYFCDRSGHVQVDCKAYQAAQKTAKTGSGKSTRRSKGKAKANAADASSTSPGNTAASNANKAEEFAGNASIPSPSSPPPSSDWNADTGATSHMTPHRHWFTTYTPYRTPVRLANDTIVYSAGLGSVRFQPVVNGKDGQLVEFERVLHVPDLRSNLLSVLYLTRNKGYTVVIDKNLLRFQYQSRLLFTATISSRNAAFLDGRVVPSEFAGVSSTCQLDVTLWHRRFGHLNIADMRNLIKREMVDGLALDVRSTPDPICEPCLAKMNCARIPKKAVHRATEPLGLIHSDLHGPLSVSTREGYKYWVTFIDDCSRFYSVMLLKNKGEAFAAFKQFKAYAENQLNCKIKALRDDKGGEFMSKEFEAQ